MDVPASCTTSPNSSILSSTSTLTPSPQSLFPVNLRSRVQVPLGDSSDSESNEVRAQVGSLALQNDELPAESSLQIRMNRFGSGQHVLDVDETELPTGAAISNFLAF